MRITVEKAKRTLVLRQGRRELLRCRCRLGSNPAGHKFREGDGRTPEGCYFVCSRNPESKFFRALGISYPSGRDARLAFAQGVIDRETCRSIERAEHMKRRPDWDTPLGGAIMIHGEPDDGRVTDCDWTAGCIALNNADMEILFKHIGHGVRVIIRR